jgi:putative hydrolase of the HAD superfamily
MTPIALVAFDLDDTLYPERAFIRSGFRAVSDYLQRERLVRRPLWPDLEAGFEAGVRDHAFDRALAAAGVTPTPPLIQTLVEIYRTRRLPDGPAPLDIRLYEDADRALTDLRRAGLRLGLVSDGPLAAQEAKVRALDLESRLDALLLTDAWGADFWKPSPRAFAEMARRLAVEPRACLYVADNPEKDFDGPAAAGWAPSVRVRRPDGLYRDAPFGGAAGGRSGRGQSPSAVRGTVPFSDAPLVLAATIADLGGLAAVLDRLRTEKGDCPPAP